MGDSASLAATVIRTGITRLFWCPMPDTVDSEQESPRELLRWYISKYETPYGKSTVPLADQLRRILTASGRLRAKQKATQLQALRMRRRASKFESRRLHLGCGWNHLEGWVNIDLVGSKADLVWDIRRDLPFPHGSMDAVFLEHVLEHMPYSQGISVLRNALQVLRPGGILRVGVPNAGMYADLYVADPQRLQDWRWGRPTPMLALREVFQEHGHVTAWDGATLLLVLQEAGFSSAQIMPAGESRLTPAPDLRERWDETVYAEAVREPSG